MNDRFLFPGNRGHRATEMTPRTRAALDEIADCYTVDELRLLEGYQQPSARLLYLASRDGPRRVIAGPGGRT